MSSLARSDILAFWKSRAGNPDTRATRFHNEHLQLDVAALEPFCGAGISVLEIGCGQCTLINALVELYGVTAHGVDVIPDFLAQALPDPRLTTEAADAVNYVPRKRYDVIIMAGLINSIPDPQEREALYQHCRDGLSENGVVFLKSQFGREGDVNVDAWSEALGAHYKSHYPHFDKERARLAKYFSVREIDAYPERLSPHLETAFHHLIGRHAPK